MKNLYIKSNTQLSILALFMLTILGSCTVYSQGQQYPDNTVYNQAPATDNGYDNSYYDDNSNEPEITFDNFQSALSPYGTWMNYGNYGQVWVCNVPGFRPYSTNGYWVNTNMGWSWNSSYNWGWAPFHYGRWGFASNIGWYWVPGYQWAPAWVYWGNASNNYAWAPVGPGMNLGVSISVGSIPVNYWTYLPGRYMGYSNMSRYYIPSNRNNVYIHNTTIINNYNVVNRNVRYNAGPRTTEVSRFTGRPVNTVRVVRSSNISNNGRIANGTMSIYSPGRSRGSVNNNPGTNNGFNRGSTNNNPNMPNNRGNNNNSERNNRIDNNNRTNNPVNNNGFNRGSTNNNPINNTPNNTNNRTNPANVNPNIDRRNPTNRNNETNTNTPIINNRSNTNPNTNTRPTNNNPNTNNSRWGRGMSNRSNNTSTPPKTTPPTQNPTPVRSNPVNTNRGSTPSPTMNRPNPSSNTRPATQPARTQNFNGGRFSNGGNKGRR